MKQIGKKLGSVLLTLCMVLAMLPTVAFADGISYNYIDKDGVLQALTIADDHIIDNNWTETALDSGFYIVTGHVTLNNNLTLSGTSLILADGSSLTVNGWVYSGANAPFAIYGQSEGTGALTVTNSSNNALSNNYADGKVGIYGGVINATATGGNNFAIYSNTIEIFNSTVTATSEIDGIYGSGSVSIQNSVVSAVGDSDGSGNGSGIRTSSGELQIIGSQVAATGGSYGLKTSNSAPIVIRGGSVNAAVNKQPTDGTNPVYKTTLYFESGADGDAVAGTVGSAGYDLGPAQLDAEKKLYLWLPNGTADFSLTVGNESSSTTGSVTVKTDNTGYWPLENHTVTFDPKGGAVTGESTAATAVGTGRLSSLPGATWEGYTFVGWYSAFYSSEQITTDTAFPADATVYARWEKDGVSPDAQTVDASKLTVDCDMGTWSYSAADKTLTVTGSTMTLTGTNANLHVDVTAADTNLTLSGASISAGTRETSALSFTAGASASNTLTLAAGSANTLTGGISGSSGSEALSSTSKLSLAGAGTLKAVTTANRAAIIVSSAELTVNGPTITANGGYFGLSMGNYSVTNGILEITAGSLTLNRTNDHYDQTLESSYQTGLTVNVRAGAALTVNDGGTIANTTINNCGGTVYIDGDVNGTANNDESGGTFTVTGGVTYSTGTISQPVLEAVTIDLANLAQAGTDYYELVTGSDDMTQEISVDFTGYTVIRIKQLGEFTLTGTAPANYVLLDESSLSRYTLNNCSIDGLVYYTHSVTVAGVNTVGAVGIPVAGGANGTCSYSGTGTLKVQNSGQGQQGNSHYAFPADEEGVAVLTDCSVEINGFTHAGDGIQVNSGSLEAYGWIGSLQMVGGSAEVWNSQELDMPTSVIYTGGTLLLQGSLDTGSTTPTLQAIFNTNGGSAVPNTYLWGYSSYQVSAPAHPEKDNSQFTGWYTDELLNTPAVFPATLTGTQNYYAAWQTHSITFSSQPTAKTAVYGSAAEYLSVTAQASNSAALSYQWYRNDSTSNTGGTPYAGATDRTFYFPTDQVGTGYYYCVVSASGCEPVASSAVLVTVEKANYGGSISGSLPVRSGVTGSYAYSLPALPAGLTWGTPVTGGATSLFSGTPTVNDGSLSFNVTAQTEDTTATISIPITGANYNDSSFTLTVTAVNKTSVSITGLTAQNATYDGTPHSGYIGTVGAGLYNGALDYTYAGRDGTTYPASTTRPDNAGDYTVTISVPDTDPDYMGSVSLNFTIRKRPVIVKADDKSVTVGSDPVFTYTVDGQLSGETALSGEPYLTFAAGNTSKAGSYTIDVVLTGVSYTDNYMAADPAYVNGTLTVSDPSSGGDTPSGGGSSTPATPAPTVSGSTATTTVTAQTGTNGTATASATQAQVTSAIEKAQAVSKSSGDAPKVEIKVSGGSNASAVQTTIPKAAVQAMVSGRMDSMTLSSPVAAMTFDAQAISAIAGAASGDVKFSASKVETSTLSDAARQTVGNHPVYDFSVTSGGSTISQFGGAVTVSVPYTPAAGENVNAIVAYYINANGEPELMQNCRYDAATGTVVFTTTHFSTYAVGYHKVAFSDVAEDAWCYDAVTFLSARGITGGTTETTFSPNATLTRGQFITLVLRAYGIEPDENPTDNFTDAGDTYYTGYLAAAKRLGISSGIGDNKFAPEQAITRQEMFTLLYNALKAIDRLPQGASGKTLSNFADSASISSYAQEAMAGLVETGIVSGSNGNLWPTATTTRGQMAQVLYNLMSK